VSPPVEVLKGGVVSILVGYEKGTPDLATVRVLTLAVEDLIVQVDVINVHGSVECNGDHLRNLE
jgi:hypothetical protein